MSKYEDPTYIVWCGMIQRCTNPANPNYPDYGGRGVRIFEGWRNSFDLFKRDLGERPKGLTLERIANDKGYFPGNVRWATRAEQNRNQRSNIRVELNGKSQILKDWAWELGIPPSTLYARVRRGWSLEEAISEKPRLVDQSWRGRVVVFAIDLSLRQAGVVAATSDFLKTRNVEAASFGLSLANSSSCDEQMRRLSALEQFVLTQWEKAGSPEIVCLEEYAFSAKTSYAHAIGEAGGVVKLAFWKLGCNVRTFYQQTARKLLTGYGGGPSKLAKAEVQRVLAAAGFEGLNEHEADALCGANWMLSEMRRPCIASPPITKGKKR